jgi:hypothetical protein
MRYPSSSSCVQAPPVLWIHKIFGHVSSVCRWEDYRIPAEVICSNTQHSTPQFKDCPTCLLFGGGEKSGRSEWLWRHNGIWDCTSECFSVIKGFWYVTGEKGGLCSIYFNGHKLHSTNKKSKNIWITGQQYAFWDSVSLQPGHCKKSCQRTFCTHNPLSLCRDVIWMAMWLKECLFLYFVWCRFFLQWFSTVPQNWSVKIRKKWFVVVSAVDKYLGVRDFTAG